MFSFLVSDFAISICVLPFLVDLPFRSVSELAKGQRVLPVYLFFKKKNLESRKCGVAVKTPIFKSFIRNSVVRLMF